MNEWTEIRRKVLVDGVSKRQILRDHQIGATTLNKMLENPAPPGYRRRVPRDKPKLGPFVGIIEEILLSDRTAPAKQRHTGKRVYERLRDEYGYTGGMTQVRDYMTEFRQSHKEVFVPLSHPPGEAQYDFGEATVVVAGVERKAALSVMTLPYSDVFHISAYPRECTESFQAGHIAAFEFFGGVPTRISYDNSRIAVKKVIGKERELTNGFLALESHFLFTHHFCRIRRGNEKGHVENLVGYSRRNFLVPVPSFNSFAELNAHLQAACIADMNRTVRGKPEGKAERFVTDQQALLQIPAESFESRRVVQARANSLSLVRFDCNDYSVPTSFAHHELTVLGGIDQVSIASGPDVVARHRRCWDKEQVFFEPLHYLALLERKPGAFDHAKPLESWNLPDCFKTLRRRLEAELGSRGTREYIKVLRLLEKASISELAGGVGVALDIGATGSDAVSLILAHRQERPVGLFSLDGHPHLKSFVIDPLDLAVYDALTRIGASA
jgi:transposase